MKRSYGMTRNKRLKKNGFRHSIVVRNYPRSRKIYAIRYLKPFLTDQVNRMNRGYYHTPFEVKNYEYIWE